MICFLKNGGFHSRRGIAVIPKTQNGHLTNANAFPNSNPNEKWSSAAPQRNNTIGPPGKSLLVPTTISAKMKSTLSAQTVQNVTFLLNNLLQQYDNSLRPDLGGKIRERWIPLIYWHVAYFAVYFLLCLSCVYVIILLCAKFIYEQI